MSKRIKRLHLWAGLVQAHRTIAGQDKPVLVSAFGSDRDAVAAVLEDVTRWLKVDKTKFQKVTVTPGWGEATRPTTLRPENCVPVKETTDASD